jgi:hypothetical protein
MEFVDAFFQVYLSFTEIVKGGKIAIQLTMRVADFPCVKYLTLVDDNPGFVKCSKPLVSPVIENDYNCMIL